MEPPKGVLSSIWNFLCFLPYFIGLLLLGTIKGIIFCPLICLIMTFGNSCIILGLWPVHFVMSYYFIFRSKQLGPVLKLVLLICIIVPLILWPIVGIVGSVIGGAAYGFLSPIFATFDAVGEGKSNVFLHCFYDGTWSTIQGSFTTIRDFADVCLHSYFSYMDDLRRESPDGKYHEIRLLHVPGAVIAAVLCFLVDMPMISLIALYKSPYMLFKGWQRLFHDLIGREGPFLETICVPFAGLAIILWPLAVVGAVLASILSSIILGAFAGVVVYQESSFWMGLCYIAASVSIYDEYSNDILDMREGSCFPRPRYRKKNDDATPPPSREASISKCSSFTKNPPNRAPSFKNAILELTPLEILDGLFNECQRQGDRLIFEGLITSQDIEEAESGKGSGVLRIGLPAYCLLQSLLDSIKANSVGILLNDGKTEVTSTNRPKDAVFEWFLNPLLIIKDQIKAVNLTVAEEDYLSKLVLLSGNPERLKNSYIGSPPESERKRAELDALARRLRGIMRSVSRYPTFRRRFDALVRILSEDLAKKNHDTDSVNGSNKIHRSKSALIVRIFSQKSFKNGKSNHEPDIESQQVLRDVNIES